MKVTKRALDYLALAITSVVCVVIAVVAVAAICTVALLLGFAAIGLVREEGIAVAAMVGGILLAGSLCGWAFHRTFDHWR